jgi:glucose-1-phosphate thymidylyltransferase
MDGILLAGGTGSRLSPLTQSVNKHLLPVYDKPLIYYPLSNLILSGADRIIVVTNTTEIEMFDALLGDGSEFGISIIYQIQNTASGIPDAIGCCKELVSKSKSVLIALGDNITFGVGLGRRLMQNSVNASRIFTTPVGNPELFGILVNNEQTSKPYVIEKPREYVGNNAVIGLYLFPPDLFERIIHLRRSERGEYEIADLINVYLQEGSVEITDIGRGALWFDAGSVESLFAASQFIESSQKRLGQLIGSPHEAAFRVGKISRKELKDLAEKKPQSAYWNLVLDFLKNQ